MVKYETVIRGVHDDTNDAMMKSCLLKQEPIQEYAITRGTEIQTDRAGLYQGFDKRALLSLCEEKNIVVQFIHPVGTYLLQGSPLLIVEHDGELSDDIMNSLKVVINIYNSREIKTNFYYGFVQLMEIAVKALSPGINDPGTAIMSIHALADLLSLRMNNFQDTSVKNQQGKVRIIIKDRSFEDVFSGTILPVWDYGKQDRLLQREMLLVLRQLMAKGQYPIVGKMLQAVQKETDNQQIA